MPPRKWKRQHHGSKTSSVATHAGVIRRNNDGIHPTRDVHIIKEATSDAAASDGEEESGDEALTAAQRAQKELAAQKVQRRAQALGVEDDLIDGEDDDEEGREEKKKKKEAQKKEKEAGGGKKEAGGGGEKEKHYQPGYTTADLSKRDREKLKREEAAKRRMAAYERGDSDEYKSDMKRLMEIRAERDAAEKAKKERVEQKKRDESDRELARRIVPTRAANANAVASNLYGSYTTGRDPPSAEGAALPRTTAGNVGAAWGSIEACQEEEDDFM